MKKSSLLGSVLAVSLFALPGLALAQSNNGNGGDNGNNSNAVPYANVGGGGFSGMNTPIPANNNNGGGGGWFGNNNGNNENNGGFGNNGNNNNGNNAANMRPSQRNPVLADNGDVRAGKLIGTTVFDTQNQNLGSVDDVLIGHNGVWAVISAKNNKVAVPFRDLRFGDANANGHDKAVLTGYSEAQLNQLPAFHYNLTNYAKYNGNNGNGNGGGFWHNANGNNNGGPAGFWNRGYGGNAAWNNGNGFNRNTYNGDSRVGYLNNNGGNGNNGNNNQ
jgi:hypothetical protein